MSSFFVPTLFVARLESKEGESLKASIGKCLCHGNLRDSQDIDIVGLKSYMDAQYSSEIGIGTPLPPSNVHHNLGHFWLKPEEWKISNRGKVELVSFSKTSLSKGLCVFPSKLFVVSLSRFRVFSLFLSSVTILTVVDVNGVVAGNFYQFYMYLIGHGVCLLCCY
ncbi:unnamed protein product, partial [Vitis vinifera]